MRASIDDSSSAALPAGHELLPMVIVSVVAERTVDACSFSAARCRRRHSAT